MNLALKHEQAVEQLQEATGIGMQFPDEETVRLIVLDESIGDHEALFLVASACGNELVDSSRLASQIMPLGHQMWQRRERFAAMIEAANIDSVVEELGRLSRSTAAAYVALICDWLPAAGPRLAEAMERLHENPELIGGEW